MSKVTNFNQKLHGLLSCDTLEMDDIKCLVSALMIENGVRFREPKHLYSEHVEKCDTKYKGDVEGMFFDEINTVAHAKRFDLFDKACNAFMDYSRFIRPVSFGVKHMMDTIKDELKDIPGIHFQTRA